MSRGLNRESGCPPKFPSRDVERVRVPHSAALNQSGELYERHARYVHVVVSRGYGERLGGADDVSSLIVDTFEAAFAWAGRQPSSEDVAARFAHPDRDCVRRKVLGWLAVVAGWLALHEVARRREIETPLPP